MKNLYQKQLSDVYSELQTHPTNGLSSSQADQRLQLNGLNKLIAQKSPSVLKIFCMQFADPLIYLLVSAATIIYYAGQPRDAFIICGILIFNAIIGTIQEKRTEHILQGLEQYFDCNSIVIRNSKQQIIARTHLVPGDIVYLSAGETIPADARIIHATNFTVDESILTGEAHAIEKSATESINNANSMKHSNAIYSGTHVISGQATAVIIATGKQTEFGKIHNTIDTINTNTPLKKELETLAHWILIFVFVVCGSLFAIGLLTHKPIVDLLVMLTALFICIVPEGLPVVMTLVLIGGAYKMAQRNVLVKHLKAIEALGRVNVIITDKTGTLTRNEMVVSSIFVDNTILAVSGTGYFTQGCIQDAEKHAPSLDAIATACALLNDTTVQFDQASKLFTIKGDPTQAATFVFAQKVIPNVQQLLQKMIPAYKIPFDSAYRYAAIFYKHNQSNIISVIGAPEVILQACDDVDPYVQEQLKSYVTQGYRVVAVAQKTYEAETQYDFQTYQNIATCNLTFLGLLAIQDEPRENLVTTLQQVNTAGIQIIMATGDHPETALYVAKKVGIIENQNHIITGQQFTQLSDEQALQLLQGNFVCARFSPHDKLRLVQLLQKQKKIVATTGDGINDVPALVASDISIAMGGTGTQLTKQAADIVLLQDSFENIVYAMQQGVTIFYALRRTIVYFLTSNMGEILIIFFALCSNLPLPLLPAQILWLNLITDGFLDVALAMEPTHDSAAIRTHPQHKNLFDLKLTYRMIFLALPMSLIGLFTFISLYKTDIALARTLTLVTLAMFQWFNAYNCRSQTKSVFTIGLFSNFWLTLASIVIFLLQALVLYMPCMQKLFTTVPLSLYQWMYAIAVASSVLFIEEARKMIMRRYFTH